MQHLLRRLAVAGQIQQQVDGAECRKNGSSSWVQFQPAQQLLHRLAGHLPRVVQSLSNGHAQAYEVQWGAALFQQRKSVFQQAGALQR
ncbi:MAG: hypothetical protein ACK559_40865, partial [bacterium]